MANIRRMRCEHSANAWRTICNNVANIRRMRGEWIATMWRHSANTWRTICNNVANIRRIRGERIATMQHSKNKNHTFVTQKPPFCTSKTILLHVKNHTFVMRICNIQKTNTLRTFRECILNGLRMRGEYHEMDCKTLRNIPTYTHEMGCEPIADALRTVCQTLLTVCQNATKHAASFGTPHNNAPTYKHKKTYKIYNRI